MLMKIAGGMLVLIASSGIGQTIGKNQEILVRELAELLSMLRLIKSELRYAINELPEAFADMAPRLKGSIGELCSNMAQLLENGYALSFQEAWDISMQKLGKESRLGKGHLSYVEKLGGILGHMDVDAQIAQLELLENAMIHEYESEREKTGQIKKLAGSIGILGGLFLIIIML